VVQDSGVSSTNMLFHKKFKIYSPSKHKFTKLPPYAWQTIVYAWHTIIYAGNNQQNNHTSMLFTTPGLSGVNCFQQTTFSLKRTAHLNFLVVGLYLGKQWKRKQRQ